MTALVELGYDGGGAAGDMDRLDDDILEGTAGQEEHDGAAPAAAVAEEVDEGELAFVGSSLLFVSMLLPDVAGNVALSSDAPKKEKRKTPYKSFINRKKQRTAE